MGALHAALLGMRADGWFEARYGDGFAVLHDGAVAEVWALHSAPEGSAAAADAARHHVALALLVRPAGRRAGVCSEFPAVYCTRNTLTVPIQAS